MNMSLSSKIALVDIVVRATIVKAAGSNFEIQSRRGAKSVEEMETTKHLGVTEQ